MGTWIAQNLGKKWWIIYADYAWGKQNNAVLQDTLAKQGGTLLGATPYPLGSAEFSAHLPKIQAAKPDVLVNVAPGADNVALHKQIKSFGMDKTMKLAQPLLWISYLKEGGPELYQDVYGGINWYWELQDSIPSAKKFVEASMKKFNMPPGDYGAYSYSRRARGGARGGAGEVDRCRGGRERAQEESRVRPLQGQGVVAGLRQQGHAGHVDRQRPRPRQDQGRLGPRWISWPRSPADEKYDRTCAEKGHA